MAKKKSTSFPPVDRCPVKNVRYIKLGEGGDWERECITGNTIRIGFGSGEEALFKLASNRRWEDVRNRLKQLGYKPGLDQRAANELKHFFQDDGTTLWITFFGRRMYWTFANLGGPITRHYSGDGVVRPVRGWRSKDALNEELNEDNLSPTLTMLQYYQGTFCNVDDGDERGLYTVNRILGKKRTEVDEAKAAITEAQQKALKLINVLHPARFELLVDLLFSGSGWRRISQVGRIQKGVDIVMRLPSTNEQAVVQVKSRTNTAEFREYLQAKSDIGCKKMFYVYHQGSVDPGTVEEGVYMYGPEEVAKWVVRAGLMEWLLEKAS